MTASRPGAAVRQLDVRQDEAGPRALDGLDRLPLGAGDLDDAMAERGDQALQVERDQRLVLDDDHVGGDLPGDLAAGLVDEALQLSCIDVHHQRRVLRRELLHGDEQEGLPCAWGQNFRLRCAASSARRRRVTALSVFQSMEFRIFRKVR